MKRYPLTYAAMCMAGLENNEEFNSQLDENDEETDLSYLSLYQYQQIRDLYPLFSAICHELAQSFVADEEHCRVGLAGHWKDNPFNLFKPYEVWFPKEAYLSWWNQKPRGMTLPKWFSDIAQEPNKDAEKTVIQPKPEVLNDQTIVDGLTVADVRAMLDKCNPRYRPELHAALCVWASFEHDPVSDGMTVKDDVKRRINDWAEDNDAVFKKSEIDRIAVVVNWDKNGNKQRPKTK